ncbi:MAG TPA: hypothetical protein VL442_16080 [Mucilaginibacter sp.]|jgi:hypothetical protein|nr:hypothetical protein [Mucilaginibacter sp.]
MSILIINFNEPSLVTMLQINASIAKHNKRIWCAFRTQHLYHYNAECVLTELDSDFEPISDKKLIAENNNTAFEDIRLFSFKDKLLAFYNYLPFTENAGWRIQYGTGFGEVDTETGLIKNQTSLRGLAKRWDEKNWSPYIFNGELFMVTDFDPFLRVIKINYNEDAITAGEIFTSVEKTAGWSYGELRGGTPLLAEPNTTDQWLYGFIHSFLPNEQGFKRYYYYTVVRYSHRDRHFEYHRNPLPYIDEEPDDEYEMLWKRSNGKHCKVIFPIGIMHHDQGVMVSFGKDDVSSYTEYFSWDRIKNLFNE